MPYMICLVKGHNEKNTHYFLRSRIVENKMQSCHLYKLPTHVDSEHSQAIPAFFHQACTQTHIYKEHLVNGLELAAEKLKKLVTPNKKRKN